MTYGLWLMAYGLWLNESRPQTKRFVCGLDGFGKWLVFQAAYRYNENAVLTAVCIISNAYENHFE